VPNKLGVEEEYITILVLPFFFFKKKDPLKYKKPAHSQFIRIH